MSGETIERFESKFMFEPNSGCWLWEAGMTNGYGCFYWSGQAVRAHRASYELYKGPIPEGLQVLHKCDVPMCVNPDHLFIGTHDDNMADQVSKNRHAFGGKNGMAKLTETQARAISQSGKTVSSLAMEFNVSKTSIYRIKQKKAWQHI